MNKKNILIVADSMDIGGIEKSLIAMLDCFDYENYNVDLRLYKNSGELFNQINPKVNILSQSEELEKFFYGMYELFKKGEFKIFFKRLRAKVVSNIFGKFKNMKEIKYYQVQLIYKYIHKNLKVENKKYDLAIGYAWPHDYIIQNVCAKKKIGWIHTDYSTIDADRKIDEKMWGQLDKIISISDECTSAFLEKYPKLKDKIIKIENIQNIKFIKEQAEKDNEKEVFDKSKFNLLSVGRICIEKGFDIAVETLSILHSKGYKNIRWNIVGFGPWEKELKDQIKNKGLKEDFILYGKQMNPYKYIKNCDLYIQPSRYEGNSVTVNEAKILAKPIIITNYKTAKSQITHMYDGYISEMTAEALAESIIKLYEDENLRNTLGENCKNNNYDNSKSLEKLYELI